MNPKQLNQQKHYSVTDLAKEIRGTLEGQLGSVWVVGEISNLHRAGSGHMYFSLKDAKSQLRAAMFKFAAKSLRFRPENGLEVICYGKVTFYEPRGDAQLVLQEMHPKGVGALQLAFEQLKKKLGAEGLFAEDRKRPLPFLPRKVGVVTSGRGAAVHDIITVLTRRFPNIEILVYPCRVQGDEAPSEIIAGVQALNRRLDVDVMIVGRGGGSIEDLWAFNDEAVARAIVASRIPVISAVGHEVDFTIADFVADLRAPTPSAAAELAVPEKAALLQHLDSQARKLHRAVKGRIEPYRVELDQRAVIRFQRVMQDRLSRLGQQLDDGARELRTVLPRRVERSRHRLELARKGLTFHAPQNRLERRREQYADLRSRFDRVLENATTLRAERLDNLGQRLMRAQPRTKLRELDRRLERVGEKLNSAIRIRLRDKNETVRMQFELLRTLNPELMLRRGYSIVTRTKGKKVISRASDLRANDAIKIRMGTGTVFGTISGVQRELDLFADTDATEEQES